MEPGCWSLARSPYAALSIGGQKQKSKTIHDGGKRPVQRPNGKFEGELEVGLKFFPKVHHGVLDVHLIEAHCLLDSDSFGKSDPYAAIYCHQEIQRSHIRYVSNLDWTQFGANSLFGTLWFGDGRQPFDAGVCRAQMPQMKREKTEKALDIGRYGIHDKL
ncbi:hypothetical protein GOP47_0024897 [Adiantum capillus-veneris]|uniref:C2 domain-containing protein n=1 Tax=Adiantum capillus-veneris TaxID=13818 RepID=A0A9D4U3M9_ADICA|nr:hypothetical protein GOP47_0024897 [Adiantum capillus-veneris]